MADARQIESPAEFLAILEKSRLLKPAELQQLQQSQATEAAAIARFLVKKERLTKWQASQLLAGVAGLWVDQYQLRDHLGNSEYGKVYLARHASRRQTVALLVLSSRHVADTALLLRVTSPLPPQSPVCDAGRAGGRYYAAIPWVEATPPEQAIGTLETWLRQESVAAPTEGGPGASAGEAHRGPEPDHATTSTEAPPLVLDGLLPAANQPRVAATESIQIDTGGGPAASKEVDLSSLSISTKRRKKKNAPASQPGPAAEKSQPAAPTANPKSSVEQRDPAPVATAADSTGAAAGSADATTPATNQPTRKSLPRTWIIAACATGVLFLIVTAGVAWSLFGRGDKEVAASAPTNAQAISTANAPGAIGVQGNPATNPVPSGSFDVLEELGMTMPTQGSSIAAGGAETATPLGAAPPASAIPLFAPAASSATPLTPVAGTAVAEVASPEAPPTADSAEADPAPGSSTAPEPMPSDSTESAAPAAAAAPPEQPRKPAPPPKTFAFDAAIDLPSVDQTDEVVLGKVLVGPDDQVFLNLLGGDPAARGRAEFVLQNAQGGVAERDWEIYLRGVGSESPTVATLSMPEQELKFRWTDVAKDQNLATNLRNCSLRINAGQGEPHVAALRKPRIIAALPIDLDKPVVSARYRVDGLPDPSSLRLEVAVQGHKATVDPPKLPLDKGASAQIIFGENREQAALLLKFDASVDPRGVEVKLSPFFLVPLVPEPLALNKKNRGRFATLSAERNNLEARVLQMRNAGQEQRQQVAAQLPQAEQQLLQITQAISRLEQLGRDYEAVQGKASLRLRLFVEDADQELNLLVTDPNAPPALP